MSSQKELKIGPLDHYKTQGIGSKDRRPGTSQIHKPGFKLSRERDPRFIAATLHMGKPIHESSNFSLDKKRSLPPNNRLLTQ